MESTYEQVALRESLLDDSYASYIESLQTQRADIKKEIQYIKSQDRLPIRRFGEKHVEVFSSSIVELIQTKDEEAKKVLFSNLL
ncbi:hypothetical protein CGH56_24990, partial [Vibrio parahaemolyticus]